MEFTSRYDDRKTDITDLFRATFTASEGAGEGAVIGAFVDRMFATTDAADLFVFSALGAEGLAGTAIFSRMWYPQDTRAVFILSPMAVAPHEQGAGTGQKLLAFGLTRLRQSGVDVALTYGDINFYSKVGFTQIAALDAQPPLPLSYPEGWLGQSLTGQALDPLKGPSSCVEALNQPALW